MYRYLLIFIFLIGLSFPLNAQFAYVGPGIAMNWTGLKGDNQVIREYNEMRPWLDNKLNTIHNLPGAGWNFGFGIAGGWMEFSYTGRRRTTSAVGTGISGVEARRQLRISNNCFNWDIGFGYGEKSGAIMGGLRMSVGNHRVRTRVFENGGSKTEWVTPMMKNMTLGLGPVIQVFISGDEIFPLAIAINAAWTFGVFQNNAAEVDEYLNGRNYWYDYPEKFNNRVSTFTLGIKLIGAFME